MIVRLIRWLFQPEESAPPLKSDAPRSVDLLWDEGQRRLAAQSDRLARLDSKATPLLGFGIAVAVLFQTNMSRIGSEAATLGTVLSGLGLLATLGVMVPRTNAFAPEFRDLLKGGMRRQENLKTKYLGNIRTAIDNNDRAFVKKTVWFKLAVGIYVVALILAGGSMLSSLWLSG